MSRAVDIHNGVACFPARTPTLPPATHTNSYALGDGTVVLVEPATPFEDEREAWLEWARELGSRRTIEAIVVTHHHPDHIGGARAFQAALGVPLWAHAETAKRLDVPVERYLDEDDVLALGTQRWRVLHTPGHAPGHVCLVEEQLGLAVVGDMVASVGTIVIDPIEGDLGRYLRELGRLERLELGVALPAHGDPIREPSALFRHYVSHRRMREAKVLAALETLGRADLDELVRVAYSDTPESLWPIAKWSLESHLLELERQGRAERDALAWRMAPSQK